MKTNSKQHFQSLSIAILAVATTVLGVVIFGASLRSEIGVRHDISILRFTTGIVAVGYYAMLASSVSRILCKRLDSELTGEDVARGPLHWMLQIIGCMIMMFILNFVSTAIRTDFCPG